MAFEPGLIPIGMDGGDGHPDMAGYSNAQATQFAADGGLLGNGSLGPALQAIADRPADREIRRVLAYVVPAAGDPGLATDGLKLADPPKVAATLSAGTSCSCRTRLRPT